MAPDQATMARLLVEFIDGLTGHAETLNRRSDVVAALLRQEITADAVAPAMTGETSIAVALTREIVAVERSAELLRRLRARITQLDAVARDVRG